MAEKLKPSVSRRKTLRKIVGAENENGEYRRGHNRELYTHVEKKTDRIRERRIALYGHLIRINVVRLTNRIFTMCKGILKSGAHTQRYPRAEKLEIHQDYQEYRS